jgi:hypothetical protein
MSISTADIRGLFTTTLVDVYRERPKTTPFLQSFFPTTVVPTKTTYIEIERFGEKVAVDVVRGTEGNRNTFSLSNQKMFEPPYYREYFDLTHLDLYDRVLGSQGNAQEPLFISFVNEVADRMQHLIDKIIRARELMCSQVFFNNGVVTMNQGVNIDFKRKSSSISNVTGDYFASVTDPYGVFVKGCNFLRQTGKSFDGTFNAILGTTAWNDLRGNARFIDTQKMFQTKFDEIVMPDRRAEGMVHQGTISAGSYRVQLWTYPQFYDLPINDAAGNTPTSLSWTQTYASTPYVPVNQVVMFPSNPRNKMVCCATPRLIGAPGQVPIQGEYNFSDMIDEWLAKHQMAVQSAPLPIPVAIDQIYTFQTSAS